MKTLEQKRIVAAYDCVSKIKGKTDLEDYKIAVNTLGVTILRSGLAAAMCLAERKKEQNKMYPKLLEHLARKEFAIKEIQGKNSESIPDAVRKLDFDAYMLTTRQMLRAIFWLKRATQSYRVEGAYDA